MIVLVSGSRTLNTYSTFCRIFEETGWKPELIVHGAAKGVDSLASRYAHEHGIEEKIFLPDWDKYGKSAGPRRNIEMCDYVKSQNGKVFVWHDGASAGAAQCKEYAESIGLEVYYCLSKKTEIFTIPALEELQKGLENAKLIGADIAKRLVKQLIEQKREYQIVAHDIKVCYEALHNPALKEKALNTATAKYLKEQDDIVKKL